VIRLVIHVAAHFQAQFAHAMAVRDKCPVKQDKPRGRGLSASATHVIRVVIPPA